MERPHSAEPFLRRIDALILPYTARIENVRKELVAAVREAVEYSSRFERIEDENEFGTQYERRANILFEAGLTTDINGNAITYPSYDDIQEAMLERPELLGKMNQGFVRVQPVPIGAPLSAYFAALEDGLRQYAGEGTLRATDGTRLPLEERQPLSIWDVYNDADRNGSLVYEPTSFTTFRHGGKTKAESIAERGPMQVFLTENLTDIPREGKGQTIGGRPQIEAGKTAEEYLEMLGKGPYVLESGYTLEAQLAHMLTHLHETQGEVIEVIDDDSESDSGASCPGGWLPEEGRLPNACFLNDGFLEVTGSNPSARVSYDGVRSGVRVA